MALTAIEIPVSTGSRHFSEDDVTSAAEIIKSGGAVSDGVLYDEPYKKMEPRTRAQYQGFYLRQDLVADGHFESLDEIVTRTWADGDGFRFAVRLSSKAQSALSETDDES